ncbi:MAG TPA: aldehyde dehydrogenase family protein, partial [Pyrinomonadaceae bacterium]|nr:aldehyde dehydrogenase family protein [Pyrinomonadaceae bacterium]
MNGKMLIGGRWTESGEAFEVRSPFSGETLATVHTADARLSDESIVSAVDAAREMRSLARFQIADGLRKIAAGIQARKDEFTRTIALEAAKPMIYARGEVERGIATFTWAAGEAERFAGDVVPVDTQANGRGKTAWTVKRPRGVIYGITPFNFPLNLVAHKVAPALAAGNSIIIKPSPRTPLTALLLGEVFLESGLPASALQVVPLDVRHLQTVFDDNRVSMVSFTGSAAVGWDIKSRIGKKALALELGGNAPVIVDQTADIKTAVPKLVTGAFAYSGQVCISVQRLFLQESIFEKWTEALVENSRTIKHGDPLDEDTRLSVMIDEEAAKRAQSWVNEAVENGARLLCGGGRGGAMLEPTIVTNTDPEMRVVSEEVFAPVLIVEKFDMIAQAVAAANQSRYGLQAGIFSNDAKAIDAAV